MLLRYITFRSLRTRPLRTLLSAFGIILGVAGILAIGVTNRLALDSVEKLFEDTSGNSSLVVTSATSDGKGFKERALRTMAGVDGITTLAPSVHAMTVLASDAPDEATDLSIFGSSVNGLLLYGIDPKVDQAVRPYKLAAGKFLSGELDAYEVVLVKQYAEDKEIDLGDRISIFTPNGPTRLRVVGWIEREGPGQLNNGAFGAIPLRTAQILFNRSTNYDQIDIVVDDAHASTVALEILQADLQVALGDDYSVIFPATQGKRMTQMLGSFQIGLNFMSGIALFVGAFLIYNAFTMTVVERTREFGMLRTVGMTRRQVIAQVLAEAAVLSVVGSALGVGLGLLMAGGLSSAMEMMLGQEIGTLRIPSDVLVTSLAVGIVVTLLAALIPALQAGHISPLEALRIRGLRKDGWLIRKGWQLGAVLMVLSSALLIWNPFPYDPQYRLGSGAVMMLFFGGTLMIPILVSGWERLARPFIRLIYGSSGRIGSSNVQRARMRTTLTVAALMIGVAMILVVQGITASFKYDLLDWVEAFMGGDIYVNSSITMRQDVWRRLELMQGVAAASPVRYLEVKWMPPGLPDETVTLMAADPVAHSRVTRFTFSDSSIDQSAALARLARGDAVFISSVISEKYGLKTGQSIRIKTRAGTRDFEIAAVVVDFYNQGLVIHSNWSDLRRYFKVNDISMLLLKVEPGFDVNAVRDRIEDTYGKRDHLTVESNVAVRARIINLMDQAFAMFDVLAYIALIVGALGVVNTLMMNVMERTQEIGMLRGVGMTRWQVVRMILAEAGIMGTIGGILGLLFGVLLARVFLLSMTAMSGYSLNFQMPTRALVAGLLVALVVSQAAAIWPARRAAQIRILDAIHYE